MTHGAYHIDPTIRAPRRAEAKIRRRNPAALLLSGLTLIAAIAPPATGAAHEAKVCPGAELDQAIQSLSYSPHGAALWGAPSLFDLSSICSPESMISVPAKTTHSVEQTEKTLWGIGGLATWN
jgi:hypothetical protein